MVRYCVDVIHRGDRLLRKDARKGTSAAPARADDSGWTVDLPSYHKYIARQCSSCRGRRVHLPKQPARVVVHPPQPPVQQPPPPPPPPPSPPAAQVGASSCVLDDVLMCWPFGRFSLTSADTAPDEPPAPASPPPAACLSPPAAAAPRDDTVAALQARFLVQQSQLLALLLVKSAEPLVDSQSGLDQLVRPEHHPHLQRLHIVGDGRCLFYSLLQAERAMPPCALEADELRGALRERLLRCYTDEQWERRVPSYMQATVSRVQFARQYLTGPRDSVPIDVAALWQDSSEARGNISVYFIWRMKESDNGRAVYPYRVLRLTTRTATHAHIVHFAADHFSTVTYGGLTVLSASHPFIRHLDELCCEYVEWLRGAKHRNRQARAAERQAGVTAVWREMEVVE